MIFLEDPSGLGPNQDYPDAIDLEEEAERSHRRMMNLMLIIASISLAVFLAWVARDLRRHHWKLKDHDRHLRLLEVMIGHREAVSLGRRVAQYTNTKDCKRCGTPAGRAARCMDCERPDKYT